MSRRAKRVWTAGVAGVAAFLMGAAVMVLWSVGSGPAAAGEPDPNGPVRGRLDPLVYARVSELRRRLRLTDEGLAALGCGQTRDRHPLSALPVAGCVHGSTGGHVSRGHPAIPDGRVSRARFWR